jgi:anti-sigma factor ChrR (cupin superfamily)
MTDDLTGDVHPAEELLVALALDDLPTSESAGLSRHLAGCARCTAEYDAISRSVDTALAAAPAQAPPAGFESRVLAQLGRPQPRRTSWLVAAAASVALAAGGVLGATLAPGSTPESLAGSELVTVSGDGVGTVIPSRYDDAAVLVMQVHDARPGARYECRLRFPDGHTEDAGYWTVPASGSGVWVARGAAGASAVELVSDEGRLWSTATLG